MEDEKREEIGCPWDEDEDMKWILTFKVFDESEKFPEKN